MSGGQASAGGSGALGGAMTGASAGTMMSPGIGTAIGAGVGAVAGGTMGMMGYNSQQKKMAQQQAEQDAIQMRGLQDQVSNEYQQYAEKLPGMINSNELVPQYELGGLSSYA